VDLCAAVLAAVSAPAPPLHAIWHVVGAPVPEQSLVATASADNRSRVPLFPLILRHGSHWSGMTSDASLLALSNRWMGGSRTKLEALLGRWQPGDVWLSLHSS